VAALLAARSSARAWGWCRSGVSIRGRRGAVGLGGHGRGRGQGIEVLTCFGAATEGVWAKEPALGFEFGDALAEGEAFGP
jgi:hypothetical protein